MQPHAKPPPPSLQPGGDTGIDRLAAAITAPMPDAEARRKKENRGDDQKWTSLMRAAANGHTKVVVELLKGSGDALRLDAQDKQDTTALMAACKSGQLDTASLLLDHGADTLLPDSSGLTALHHSASAGHDLVVKALLQQPDDVVQQLAGMTDGKHMTPLMLACQNGCEGAVRLLLGSKKASAGVPAAAPAH